MTVKASPTTKTEHHKKSDVSTILILDDEAAVRRRLRSTLAPLGHVLLEAATAEEAVRCFEETDSGLDLLIADVHLPMGTSGVRVALEFRSLLPRLRILLISGFPPSLWDDGPTLMEGPFLLAFAASKAVWPGTSQAGKSSFRPPFRCALSRTATQTVFGDTPARSGG
jgi:hypothetical protein